MNANALWEFSRAREAFGYNTLDRSSSPPLTAKYCCNADDPHLKYPMCTTVFTGPEDSGRLWTHDRCANKLMAMQAVYTLEVTVGHGHYDQAVDQFWIHHTTALLETSVGLDNVRLTGAFDSEEQLRAAERALKGLGEVSSVGTKPLADLQDQWHEQWKAGAEPHRVGNIGVGLSNHRAVDCLHWITIDPAGSFGHGAHPTTSMLLDLLQSEAATLSNWTAADIGTGSGVLAIAAASLGAAEVVGVDTSADAIAAATANLSRNAATDRVRVCAGTTDVLDGTYNLVLANMIAGTLLDLEPELRRLTDPNGLLLVSGLRSDQRDVGIDIFNAFTVVDERDSQGWCALALSPKSD